MAFASLVFVLVQVCHGRSHRRQSHRSQVDRMNLGWQSHHGVNCIQILAYFYARSCILLVHYLPELDFMYASDDIWQLFDLVLVE